MGKCYPITRFLDCCGISHLYSQPNAVMERAIKKVSHGSHQSPQSHFAVPTMEGMALGPRPVRTLASLALTAPTLRNTPVPPRPRARLHVVFTEQSYRSRWKQVRQKGEQSYRFATVARRRTGRETLLGEDKALYGCLGAGMTTFGTGRRREERQADPPAAAARC
jgi:hypothetical protein